MTMSTIAERGSSLAIKCNVTVRKWKKPSNLAVGKKYLIYLNICRIENGSTYKLEKLFTQISYEHTSRGSEKIFENRPSRASVNVVWKVGQIQNMALIYSLKRNASPHHNIS